MVSFLTWQDGKKTYMTVIVGVAVAVTQCFGVHIPWYVDAGLGFIGLGFHRMGVSAQQDKITADVSRMIQDALVVFYDVKPLVTKDDTAPSAPIATVTVTSLPPIK